MTNNIDPYEVPLGKHPLTPVMQGITGLVVQGELTEATANKIRRLICTHDPLDEWLREARKQK